MEHFDRDTEEGFMFGVAVRNPGYAPPPVRSTNGLEIHTEPEVPVPHVNRLALELPSAPVVKQKEPPSAADGERYLAWLAVICGSLLLLCYSDPATRMAGGGAVLVGLFRLVLWGWAGEHPTAAKGVVSGILIMAVLGLLAHGEGSIFEATLAMSCFIILMGLLPDRR